MTGEKKKYELFKYSSKFQSLLDMNIYHYKKLFFTKNIPVITKDNLFNYYDNLKRKYKNKYQLYDIKNYFVEFFCKFIGENDIIYELNASHELAQDILLCNSLKKIKLIININDFKTSYKTEKIKDKNKKSFLSLFQTIFDIKRISKILEIIIISKRNEESDKNSLFIKALATNIYKFKPKIKTNDTGIYFDIFDYSRELKEYEGENYNIFKFWKLIVPCQNICYISDEIYNNINFDIDLTNPIDIKNSSFDLDFIKKYKIKNYFIKLNYEDLWSFNDDFTNIKKLELNIKDSIIEDITNCKEYSKLFEENGRRRRGRGRGKNMNLGLDQNRNIEEITKKFYSNNMPYIQFFNKFKNFLDKINEEEESRLKFLKFFETSKFDDLTILLNVYYGNWVKFSRYCLNKLINSIELYLVYYNPNEIQFLNELKKYKSIKISIHSCKEENNKEKYNILKFDKESNVEHFYLSIYFYDFIPKYNIDFPINFEKLITLDLSYSLVLNRTTHINFPLTEKYCKYKFLNLKNLKLNFFYDCDECIYNSPKELIPYLTNNLQFCPLLENFDISYEIFEKNIDELYLVLEGIKCLKYLKSLYINSKIKEVSIINTNEFFKVYPEYLNYCPFLNDIKFKISDLLKYDLLYEKYINYKYNDIVIKDYLYIKTLGQKSSYATYLCKNKENKKVVIRKLKKSRINNSLDLFNNEKYCLKKFKNNKNVINYIDFYNDKHFEYIIYEYIENTITKYNSKIIKNNVCDILLQFYMSSRKDKNIIILPILPTNILITNNYDVILLGFGYLNLYPNGKEKKGKLSYFYRRMNTYFKENFSLSFLNNYYNEYIDDIKNYYDYNFNWSYALAKTRFKNLKIKNKLEFVFKVNICKIILNKDFIFTLQNNAIIVYDKLKFNKITGIINVKDDEDEDEEEDETKEDEKFNLINFILIDDNILVILDSDTIYTVSFIKNKLKIIDEINYRDLNENNINNKIKNISNKDLKLNEIVYIEKDDIILTCGNGVCSWQINKKNNKLKFIKFYPELNNYTIFPIKNSNIPLINIDNEKLIFYSINNEFDIITEFEYIHNIKNWPIYELKLFKQKEEYCYALLYNTLIIFKIINEQKKIDCLYKCCFKRKDIKYIFPVQKGIFFGSEQYSFDYLTKVKDDYKIIDYFHLNFEYDEYYDIIPEKNNLFVVGHNSIIEYYKT